MLGLPPAFNLSHDQTLQFKVPVISFFGMPEHTQVRDYLYLFMSEGHDSISNNLFSSQVRDLSPAPNELTVLLTLESSIYVRQKPNSKRPLLLLDRSVKELELGTATWESTLPFSTIRI